SSPAATASGRCWPGTRQRTSRCRRQPSPRPPPVRTPRRAAGTSAGVMVVKPAMLGRVNHPDAFAPAELGPITLRNRIIKAATFEGVTREHVVSKRLIEFHRAVARGGVGMTTVAYCAV